MPIQHLLVSHGTIPRPTKDGAQRPGDLSPGVAVLQYLGARDGGWRSARPHAAPHNGSSSSRNISRAQTCASLSCGCLQTLCHIFLFPGIPSPCDTWPNSSQGPLLCPSDHRGLHADALLCAMLVLGVTFRSLEASNQSHPKSQLEHMACNPSPCAVPDAGSQCWRHSCPMYSTLSSVSMSS